MRFLLLPTLVFITSACSLLPGGENTARRAEVSPEEVLRRSDEAMRASKSFRAVTKVVPSVPGNPPYDLAYEFRGTRCVVPAGSVPKVEPNGACPCGANQIAVDHTAFFDRAKGGQPFGPPFAGGTSPANIRLENIERVDGRSARVVTYDFRTPSEEGPFTVWRKEWIEQGTFRLLRQEQWDDDRFGVRAHVTTMLSAFDALPMPACR